MPNAHLHRLALLRPPGPTDVFNRLARGRLLAQDRGAACSGQSNSADNVSLWIQSNMNHSSSNTSYASRSAGHSLLDICLKIPNFSSQISVKFSERIAVVKILPHFRPTTRTCLIILILIQV